MSTPAAAWANLSGVPPPIIQPSPNSATRRKLACTEPPSMSSGPPGLLLKPASLALGGQAAGGEVVSRIRLVTAAAADRQLPFVAHRLTVRRENPEVASMSNRDVALAQPGGVSTVPPATPVRSWSSTDT